MIIHNDIDNELEMSVQIDVFSDHQSIIEEHICNRGGS